MSGTSLSLAGFQLIIIGGEGKEARRSSNMNQGNRHPAGKTVRRWAVYMRDRVPEMEYVFCDTQKELPETYEYLDQIQAYLGKPIHRLNAERGFDHWLQLYGGYALFAHAMARGC